MMRLATALATLAATVYVWDGTEPYHRHRSGGAVTSALRLNAFCTTPGTTATVVADTGQVGTFSRASTETCFAAAGNSMVSAAGNSMCVSSGSSAEGIAGCFADAPSTNYQLDSNNLNINNWSHFQSTVTSAAGTFVDGTTTLTRGVSTGSDSELAAQNCGAGMPAYTTLTDSMWLQAGTDTTGYLAESGGAANWTAFSCWAQAPATCSTLHVSTIIESDTTGLTSTPLRVVIQGTSSTNPSSSFEYVGPGQLNGSGTTVGKSILASGGQVEVGTFATSFKPTTTTAVAGVGDKLTFSSTGLISGASAAAACFHWHVTPEFDATLAGTDRPLLSTTGLSVYFRAATAKFELTAGGKTADTLALTFAQRTGHDVYARYTVGGNACVKVDSAAEVCTAAVATFSPDTTFYFLSDSGGGFGGWADVAVARPAALAPGSCT